MDNKYLDKLQKSNTIVYTFRWNKTKSSRLKRIRGVSFEEIIQAKYLGIHDHPSRVDQKILAYEYKSYFWAVPFVYEENSIFLKTLYPSCKYKKLYKKER